MEDDHRVWPPEPGPGHRRTPPEDSAPARGGAHRDEGASRATPRHASAPYVPEQPEPPEPPERRDEAGWGRPPDPPPAFGRRERPYEQFGRRHGPPADPGPDPGRGRDDLAEQEPRWGRDDSADLDSPWGRRGHPLDLDQGEPEEPAWGPRIRGAAPREPNHGRGEAWEDLPPSARLHGSPADPGLRRRSPAGPTVPAGGGLWRRVAVVLAALIAGTGLVAGAAVAALRLTAPPERTGLLRDALAGVAATLPQGWSAGSVAPVTGFTSVVRDERGALVMARPVPGPVTDVRKATAEAAELYSRLLLNGDRVSVVDDRKTADGHTRALRAEYKDVVNRPAFLRVMLVTRTDRSVLLVGLLQPEDDSRRQALDEVMTSVR
ncbi:hypothetical protein GCM10009733_099860 [Nonomuraea maheshkhaliensis]|uniref:DUF1795 domain-containing protein n=1 Tax=Nonomuraea maheshkhaliensis TaxID=419590 RepID=A0ABP4TFD3_9ACTN